MHEYILICSVDGVNIDYEEIITADAAPGFWECYHIAESHGCSFFTIDEIEK